MSDLISREALKKAINSSIAQATKVGIMADADYLWELLNYAIDNAPTVKPCDNCDLYFKAMTTKAMREAVQNDI